MKSPSSPPINEPTQQRGLRGFKRRVRHRIHRHPKWIITACLVIALLALAMPHLYTFYLASRWPVAEIGHGTEPAFLSLMYVAQDPADSDTGTAITPEQLARHLRELSAAGYQFIGLQHVQGLMREGTALPDRAILIGIDYRGTTDGWEPWKLAVVRAKARAVLFVDPDNPNRPAWRLLRQTAATPHWDIAAIYHHDDEPETGASAQAGIDQPPRSTATQYNRLHTLDQAAVRQHRQFRNRMHKPFPSPVMALAYPYSVSGQTRHADEDITRHLLARNAPPFFELGFVPGGLAYNTRLSDRFFLNSRIVPATWDENDLIGELRAYRNLPFEIVDADNIFQRTAWTQVFGTPISQTDNLLLQAKPDDVTGLWLGGSDQMKTFDAEIRFSLDHGILRIPFMATADESSRWELSLEAGGPVTLNRRRWEYNEVIARDMRSVDRGRPLTLRLTQRHDQVWVTLDGRPLFGGWIPLNEPAHSGLLGVRLSSNDNRPAMAAITAFRVSPPTPTIALMDGPPEQLAYGIRWAGQRAQQLTAISPPLEQMQSTTSNMPVALPGYDLFTIATRIHGWDLIPHTTLRQPHALDGWTPENVLAMLQRMDSDGILFRLDDGIAWPESRLADWGRNMAAALRDQGYRLFIRLPVQNADGSPVTATLGRVPGVQWVTAGDIGELEARQPRAVEIRVPAPDPEADLQMVYDLLDGNPDRAGDDDLYDLQQRRDQAEARYAAGEYEDAIAIWFEWHERDPLHPLPLRRIGDALQRLGYYDESVELYRQSLERDPGNIALAVLLADWIDASGNPDEARNLLFVYDLLFPDHPSILLAQAVWFHRHNQPEQSRVRIERLLEKQPDNLQALLMMAQLGVTASQRQAAMQNLVRLTGTPEDRHRVLQGIRDADLMVLPEADILLPMLQASATDDEAILALLNQLKPRDTQVSTSAESWPDQTAWRVNGDILQTERAHIQVRAAAGREDAELRLNGSERWRDVFVEADLAQQHGEFWLTARWSRDHRIRFGFDAEGDHLRLQVWRITDRESRLLSNQSRPWQLPEGGARLRLEVRGAGVAGYIDGEPWGEHAVALSPEISPGWIAVSARSVTPGTAEMTLRRIAAGPVFPVIAQFSEPLETETADRLAERLYGLTAYVNTISPSGFSIDAGGRWSSPAHHNDAFSRLFARYHAFRLMPHVQVDPAATIHAADILQAAVVHKTDGFVLEFRQPPDPGMLEQIDRDLDDAPIGIMVLIHREDGIHLHAMGRSRLLLPGTDRTRRVSIVSADSPEARAELRNARLKNPALIRM